MQFRKQISLTRERLREVLDYDTATGVFTWRVRPAKNIAPGTVAGSVKSSGHRYVRIDEIDYTAQRLAWFYVHGAMPKHQLNFVNDNPLDLRIDNLVEGFALTEKFDNATREGRMAHAKAWRVERRDYWREFDLIRNFGIDQAAYDKILADQNGACKLCHRVETGTRNGKVKALAVDHDHETGHVRGLLCEHCNTGLGKLRDDPETLRRAADYIERHRAAVSGNVVPLTKREA